MPLARSGCWTAIDYRGYFFMELKISSSKFGNRSIIFDDDDYQKIKDYKWHIVKIGFCFYAESCIGVKRIRMHRLITNAEIGQIIDHIDHDGLNNSKSNLRVVSKSQNSMNQRKRINNKSGFRGVYIHKQINKFHAQIKTNGKRVSLGLFDKAVDAAIAYNKAAVMYYKEYACLNVIL